MAMAMISSRTATHRQIHGQPQIQIQLQSHTDTATNTDTDTLLYTPLGAVFFVFHSFFTQLQMLII